MGTVILKSVVFLYGAVFSLLTSSLLFVALLSSIVYANKFYSHVPLGKCKQRRKFIKALLWFISGHYAFVLQAALIIKTSIFFVHLIYGIVSDDKCNNFASFGIGYLLLKIL